MGSEKTFRPYLEIMTFKLTFLDAPSAPADADIKTGTVVLWLNATNGAATLNIRGKTEDGTIIGAVIDLQATP